MTTNETLKSTETRDPVIEQVPIMSKPDIIAVDLGDSIVRVLQGGKFNVNAGSFGTRYIVPQGKVVRAVLTHRLPYLEEKDIIIINPNTPETIEQPTLNLPGFEQTAEQRILYSPEGQNYFDPRPFIGASLSNSIRKVIINSGILITFNVPLYTERYYSAKLYQGSILPYSNEDRDYDNYSFLPFQTRFTSVPGKRQIVPTY